MARQRIQSPPIEASRGLGLSPSAPAEILDLPERRETKKSGPTPWTPPEFWPEGLDPMDNQSVCFWLLGEGPWEGQEPGWRHYALDPSEAAMKPGTWAWHSKRTMDITLVLLGLPFVLPIVALAAFAVFFTIGRPIHFRQYRPGYLGKPFKMYKLRTMTLEGDSESPREDGERLTSLGRFLRKTSIDELPQLLNVLKGEMSLVGPRPQLASYLPRLNSRTRIRYGSLPGITGLAQIKGRNHQTWAERLVCDKKYLSNWNLFNDIAILLRTIWVVFSGKGVASENVNTNEEFFGESQLTQ
jgi:sugar transferase EpsL